MSTSVELVWHRQAQLGEGPVWHQGTLWWVDIVKGDLLAYTPGTGERRAWRPGGMLGTVVPCVRGGLMVAGETGFFRFDPATGQRQDLDSPPSALMNGRFNDGKCDPRGNLVAGTINMAGTAGLFRLCPDLSWQHLLGGVQVSNGLGWWEEEFLYIDTPTQRVDRFDFDRTTGEISQRRPAFSTADLTGSPDGMTIDSDGNLWIAFWDGAQIRCLDRETGRVLHHIPLPCPRVTACWFGGDDLGDLYITTARAGLTEEQLAAAPLSGSLFCCRPGATGLAATAFGG